MDRSALAAAGVSPREAEVFRALRSRPTNAELAAALFISERTVESHISSLLRKMGVINRLELAKLAVLNEQTESARAALPAPLDLLADRDSFFGRTSELARLVDTWDQAAAGRVLVRLVTGEAGIGKSRLVAELSAHAQHGGGCVLLGACVEDSPTPFQPFRQALVELDASLRMAPSTSPLGEPIGDVEARRAELAERIAASLLRLGRNQPHLIVIEDLHWATPSTREVVRHVALASAISNLLVVVTSRDTAPDLHAPLAAFIGDLDRLPTVEIERLAGLDEPAVTALLGWMHDEGDPGALRAATGGNPLLLRERESLGRPIGTLQSLLAHRGRLLPDTDLKVLDVAAAIGVEIRVELLSAATNLAVMDVVDTLERASEAGIAAPLPGRAGMYTFVHDLFRSVRYEQMPNGRRMRVHAEIAAALERRGDDPDARARHACLAAPLEDPAIAARLAFEAGNRIANLNDPETAGRRYEWGLDVVDLADPPVPDIRLLLKVRYGQSLALRGDGRARDVLLDAVREARALGATEVIAEAALSMSPVPGGAATPGRADDEFTDVAEFALEHLSPGPSALRIELLAALAVQLRLGSDRRRGMTLADQAVALGRELGDDHALGYALLAWRYGGTAPDRVDLLAHHGDELTGIGRRLDHPLFVHAGVWMKAAAQRQQGELALAARTLERAPHIETPWVRLLDEARSISDDLLAGDLRTARRRADDFGDRARAHGEAFGLLFGTLDVMVCHHEGRLHTRARTRRPSPRTAFVLVDAVSALTFALAGYSDDAVDILDSYLRSPDDEWRADYSYLLAVSAFADAACITGHAAVAPVLLEMLAPHAGDLAAVNAFVSSSVDYHRADLWLLNGDAGRAAEIAEAAVAASRERGTALFLGRELALLAEALARVVGRVDPRASPLCAEARAIADATGGGLILLDLARRDLS